MARKISPNPKWVTKTQHVDASKGKPLKGTGTVKPGPKRVAVVHPLEEMRLLTQRLKKQGVKIPAIKP